ncbi:hypothetical protein ACTHAM_000881 [Cellulomonas soli]|uniref:hypothetical protein n=1 Tax=Cellulomonas soli TaxID=931535 RepID=UPI003F848E5E
MPSYRVSLAVGLLRPGTAAPDLLPELVDVAGGHGVVEASDLAVVRGQARVTVRFTGDDDAAARRVAWAVLARADELAETTEPRFTRRYGARWYPVARARG